MNGQGGQGGRIATGDRLQFAHQLFDRHAEEIYHYVLAWTGEQAAAVDLTTTVLRTAVARMDQLVEGDDAELEMRLIALVRAAVTRWRALEPPGRRAAMAVPEESMPLFDGLGELDDDQREALILCELLGQEPERASRLLGRDRLALQELRDGASEALWRAMNGIPAGQPVSTWNRLTAGTALRQAAGGWLSSADETVLAYVSEQLFGEAPVGVPATAPAHAAAAVKAARPGPAAASVAAAAAPGHAGGEGEAGAGPDGQAPQVAVPEREQPERAGLRQRVAALVLPQRGSWGAWGIAAAAAAGLGVIAA